MRKLGVVLFALYLCGCSSNVKQNFLRVLPPASQGQNDMSGVWVKKGVILPPNTSDLNGGVFFGGTSNGTVLFDGNAQLLSGNVFKMWFQGADDLFYAESTDGINWTRRATAILTNFGLPRVFKNGSTYYLYGSPSPTGVLHTISAYTSSDGITWTLQSSTALQIGGVGQWDHSNVSYLKPFYQDGGGTWYASYSTQLDSSHYAQIGIATSTDLITWTNGANFIQDNCGSPDAHVVNGHFYIWTGGIFTGASHSSPFDGSRIDSSDLVTWTSPIQTFPRTRDDEGVNLSTGAVGPQVLVEAGGQTYNFYTGTPTEPSGIGYQMMVAIAPMTLAQLVTTSEGINVPMGTSATDNFTRANETPLSNNGAWAIAGAPNVAMNLTSNKAVASSTGFASRMAWTAFVWPNDHTSAVTIGAGFTSTSQNGVNVRMATATNSSYEFIVTPTGWTLRKIVSGSATNLDTGSLTFAAGDIISISVAGTTITAFKNGTQISQKTDSAIAAGSPGFTLFDSATPTNSSSTLWNGSAGTNISGDGGSNPGEKAFIIRYVRGRKRMGYADGL